MFSSISELRSTQDAFSEALMKIGIKNSKIVVLDADSQNFTKTHLFSKYCSERYLNLGLSFSDVIGTAIGLAIQGRIPFVCDSALYITGKDWEQIRNCICYPNLNVKFVGVLSGLSSEKEGPLMQCFEDIALMRCLPNMKIFCPSDSFECQKIAEFIVGDFGPAYLRLNKINVPIIHNERTYQFKNGIGNVLQSGENVCLISYGHLLTHCLEVYDLLQQEGLSVGVINISSIKPIDEGLIEEMAKKYKTFVVVEDHNVIGGLGSAICEIVSCNFPVKVVRLGIPDRFGEPVDNKQLYEIFDLTAKKIYLKVKELCNHYKAKMFLQS